MKGFRPCADYLTKLKDLSEFLYKQFGEASIIYVFQSLGLIHRYGLRLFFAVFTFVFPQHNFLLDTQKALV